MATVASITVTKSSPVLVGPATAPAVAPATATDHHYVNLSSFDKALAFFPVTSFHIFSHAIHKPAETLRSALSRALVHYFPVAGRFIHEEGELRIDCTGEGVAFVAASASCSLRDVKLFDPPHATLLRELAVSPGAGAGFRPSDPLLLFQVTEFACGGFVVGVTLNHGIADCTGFAQFMQAVGELARGLPRPAVLPVRCGDDTLPELPPVVATIERMMGTLARQDFAYLDITIPSSCIDRIKAGFAGGGHADDEPCTVFEAVVAVLWQCRTRAVMSDPSAPAPLGFSANVRGLVGARRGYYGNCITSAVVVPASGEVASGHINDVVALIKRGKRQVSCHFKDNAVIGNGGGSGGGDEEEEEGSCRRLLQRATTTTEQQFDVLGAGGVSAEQLDVLFGYNAFVVTSWRNLGADAVDFGGGTPARVMCLMEQTPVANCVACLPYKGRDGANVLALCVKEDDADAFLAELAKFV